VRKDTSDDDDDSYEAQLRRQDREDFNMEAIDAGHEDCLRSDARYTIPTSLLQSGAETPSRGDKFYTDVPSRAPSPPGLPLPSLALAPPRPSTSRRKIKLMHWWGRRPAIPPRARPDAPLFARLARSYAIRLRLLRRDTHLLPALSWPHTFGNFLI
jgi:hypothetical protein